MELESSSESISKERISAPISPTKKPASSIPVVLNNSAFNLSTLRVASKAFVAKDANMIVGLAKALNLDAIPLVTWPNISTVLPALLA